MSEPTFWMDEDSDKHFHWSHECNYAGFDGLNRHSVRLPLNDETGWKGYQPRPADHHPLNPVRVMQVPRIHHGWSLGRLLTSLKARLACMTTTTGPWCDTKAVPQHTQKHPSPRS